tara:strand:- start:1143 stop:1814 length:672 start_codon:yes stop_codon:yes gene_type:complete
MLVKEAIQFGKISNGNTKMPGTTFSIDAFACQTGSKLAKIKGTSCNSCYARKLQKLRPSVDMGYKLNLAKYNTAVSDGKLFSWVSAMVFQIERQAEKTKIRYHRWFDAGDLQSEEMFKAICLVCERTPKIAHWLPTQEREYINTLSIPPNLCVRISGAKVNGKPNMLGNGAFNLAGVCTSTVHTKDSPSWFGQECKAYTRNNNCGDCRACWNKGIKNISYKKH